MIDPTTVAASASRVPSPGTRSAPAARTSSPTPRSPHRTARSNAERVRSCRGTGRIDASGAGAMGSALEARVTVLTVLPSAGITRIRSLQGLGTRPTLSPEGLP